MRGRLVRWCLGGGLLDRAARDDDGPLTRAARAAVLEAADPAALQELARRALDRPALAAWCARQDVVPAEAGTAAALFLLTGQVARYRAIDPDAGRLAEALACAGPERRGRLLAALADAGDVDPVAVAAARQRGGRLVWDLPLAEAAAAVGGFGAWRPAAETDAALFDRLAGEDPAWVAAAVAALPVRVRIDVPGRLTDLALAPDASRIAAVYQTATGYRLLDVGRDGGGRHAYDLALGGGPLTDALSVGVTRHVVVHLGDAVLAADGDGLALFEGGLRRPLDRARPGRRFHAVAALGTAGGWVALGEDGRLVLGARGAAVRAGAEPVIAVRPGTRLAGAPDGRHVVVAADDRLVLLDAGGRPAQAVPWAGGALAGVAFTGSGRLVALERAGGPPGLEGRLYRWRITRGRDAITSGAGPGGDGGGELVEEAVTAVSEARNLDALDGRTLVLDTGEELLHLRDADSFAARAPIGVETARIPYPRGAAGFVAVNRHWLRTEHAVDVYPPAVHRLAERPLAQLTPGDLETLDGHLDRPTEADPRTARLLRLLRDCLAIRFAADVTLGRRDHLAEDDIALGPGPRRPGPAKPDTSAP